MRPISTEFGLFAASLCVFGILNPSPVRAQSRIASQLAADRCISPAGGSSAAGTKLVTANCQGGQEQQFTLQGNGEIRIFGMCVDAMGGSGNDGDAIGLWPCNGGANQRWTLTAKGELRGINGKCIDIPGGNTAFGVGMILWRCNDAANQRWTMRNTVSARPAKLYVIDGTNSQSVHRNSLYHVYERWSGPKLWQNGVNLVATDIDPSYSHVYSVICNDAKRGTVGDVYLLGYSRGAIMMVKMANEVRQNCGANVRFLGLVDAVNTGIWNWPVQVNPGIPYAVHLRKPRGFENAVTTRDINGIRTVLHPQDVNHRQIVCNVDGNGSAWRWTVDQLVNLAQSAGGRFNSSRIADTYC